MEQIQYIPLDKIEVDPQVRKAFDEESIDGLVASLKVVGQLQPIRVRKVADKFRVVCGERRTRAARLAGLTTLAAIIEVRDLSEGEVLQRQIIENCQRENLCPIEKARGITRLMEVMNSNTNWGPVDWSNVLLGAGPITAVPLGCPSSLSSRSSRVSSPRCGRVDRRIGWSMRSSCVAGSGSLKRADRGCR